MSAAATDNNLVDLPETILQCEGSKSPMSMREQMAIFPLRFVPLQEGNNTNALRVFTLRFTWSGEGNDGPLGFFDGLRRPIREQAEPGAL